MAQLKMFGTMVDTKAFRFRCFSFEKGSTWFCVLQFDRFTEMIDCGRFPTQLEAAAYCGFIQDHLMSTEFDDLVSFSFEELIHGAEQFLHKAKEEYARRATETDKRVQSS